MALLIYSALLLSLVSHAAPITGKSRLAHFSAIADSVAICQVIDQSTTTATTNLKLSVIRSLKGPLSQGTTIAATHTPLTKSGEAKVSPQKERGLFFLKSNGANAYNILSLNTGNLGPADSYLSLPGNDAPLKPKGNSVLSAIYAELFAAMESRPHDEPWLMRLAPYISPQDSLEVSRQLYAWMNGANPNLRRIGIAGLITTGNIQALRKLINEMKGPPAPLLALAQSSLLSWRNPAPEGVNLLGSLLDSPQLTGCSRNCIATSLQILHTRESLVYLHKLLDSEESFLRETAVAGFSAFALNMRIPSDSADQAKALDEVLNPGRRRQIPSADAPFDTPETRAFAHFGPFRNADDRRKKIHFWSSWYQTNKAILTRSTASTAHKPGGHQ